jgi:RNA polymerase sigma-32 factor
MLQLPTDDEVRQNVSETPRKADGDGAKAKAKAKAPTLLPPPKPTSSSTLPAKHDPLSAYMADVRRFPLLTPEQEKELAVRYVETEDPDAAYKLITSNLRLVVKIAFKYQRFYKNVLDLIQEGNVGLMQAVKKYDPHRGVRLSSYARYWIRAYIMYFLLANHRLVKVGTTQAQRKLFYNLSKETKKLRDQGFDPTPKLIAERLNVEEREVVEMSERLAAREASLDAPIGDDEARTLGGMLQSNDPMPDQQVADEDFRARIGVILKAFGADLTDERETTLWYKRIMSEDPLTLGQVGDIFGFSRERARQIEARMKLRLKDHLIRELGEEALLGLDLVQ